MKAIDERMIQLIDILKSKGLIKRQYEFCDVIGLLPSNLAKIKRKESSFTLNHVGEAVAKWSINPAWIFGIGDSVFMTIDKEFNKAVNKAVNID